MTATTQAVIPEVYLIAATTADSVKAAQAQIDIVRTAGAQAIKVSNSVPEAAYSRSTLERPTFNMHGKMTTRGDVIRQQALSFDSLRQIREYARGRTDFIVSARDSVALTRGLSLEPDGIFLPGATVSNSQLVEQALAPGQRAFVEISLSLPNECQLIRQAFAEQPVTLVLNTQAFGARPIWRKLLGLIVLKRLGFPIGLGGIGGDTDLAVAGLAAGATVLETNLSLISNCDATDMKSAAFLMLAEAVREFQEASECLALPVGDPDQWDAADGERAGMVAARDIRAGETITATMIAFKAPYRGLSPRMLDQITGCQLLYDISADEPITLGNISV